MGGTALLDWVEIIDFHGAAIHHLNPQDKMAKENGYRTRAAWVNMQSILT